MQPQSTMGLRFPLTGDGMMQEWELLWKQSTRHHWKLAWNSETSRNEPQRQVKIKSHLVGNANKVKLQNGAWFLVDPVHGTKEIVTYADACTHLLDQWRKSNTPKRKFQDDYQLRYTGLVERDVRELLPYVIALSPERYSSGRIGGFSAIQSAIRDVDDESEREVLAATSNNGALETLQGLKGMQSETGDDGQTLPLDSNLRELSAHQMDTQAIESRWTDEQAQTASEASLKADAGGERAKQILRRMHSLLVEENERMAAQCKKEAEWAKVVKKAFANADEQEDAQAIEQGISITDRLLDSNEEARQLHKEGEKSYTDMRLAIKDIRKVVKELQQIAEEVEQVSMEIKLAIEEPTKVNEEQKIPSPKTHVGNGRQGFNSGRSGDGERDDLDTKDLTELLLRKR